MDSTLQTKIDAATDLLTRSITEYGTVTLANSLGAEDMVLTHLIYSNQLKISIFSLDTGRLNPETLDVLAKIYDHYHHRVTVYSPDTAQIEAYVNTNGINAFYESLELRKKCCSIRKIMPLKRALQGNKAWITGLRREQSANRSDLADTEWDEGNQMHKLNPLIEWTEKEVWTYIKHFKVPYNDLHDQHYPSIGCAPCTRAIAAGEDVRAGRWWWEQDNAQECGLH